MKRLFFASLIVAALVAVLATTSTVFAQGPNPSAQTPGGSYGKGRGSAGGRAAVGTGAGVLHDAMIAFYADEFGLTVDELNTRLANGETIAQIAYASGYTTEQFVALQAEARAAAIDQAVKAGTLTREQADWMKQRGTMAGNGARGGMGGRGMWGAGAGSGNADCPYYPQTTP